MWDLRWVLVGLGALVVVGVYLWSKGLFSRALPLGTRRQQRSEPTIGASAAGEPGPAVEPYPQEALAIPLKHPRGAPERIITLRLIPRGEELAMERAVLALRSVGLEHGRYGIFHRMLEGQRDEPAFSVASLTEPGSFDLNNLANQTIAGLSLFVVLPGTGDAVGRFDAMVETARALSVELEADLHDERGSSWSVQRERYIREEIIKYRHHTER
ncbi:MAG TPA: cell division protein ZipA C-terminal FtsZ-binding domain-containing protein [Gammaproteobacteria bacterium]|nr:cell division protein ZipA C-terminal FtsZ-binding domain-containing protein [Gammaproteobacteria bacterium]